MSVGTVLDHVLKWDRQLRACSPGVKTCRLTDVKSPQYPTVRHDPPSKGKIFRCQLGHRVVAIVLATENASRNVVLRTRCKGPATLYDRRGAIRRCLQRLVGRNDTVARMNWTQTPLGPALPEAANSQADEQCRSPIHAAMFAVLRPCRRERGRDLQQIRSLA